MITSTEDFTPNRENFDWKRMSKHINAKCELLDSNKDNINWDYLPGKLSIFHDDPMNWYLL